MAKPLQCVIVTPEQTALSQEAEFVALPLYDGELGVASNHSPLIGRLGYGELRVKSGGTTTRWYVDGGFVEVADNVVSVLTNRAVPAGKIDGKAAGTLLEAAMRKPAHSPELLEIRDRQIAQARAQIRVAARNRL
ncbi:MAG: ATP synthase F1 subunit epsilon [Pirellulaceae bacterium]|nr:ATP synthase F1 subunit epsilon [Pirellulaceae bacterium]